MNKMNRTLTTSTALLATFVLLVQGHGYMENPPGRSSAWRKGFHTPKNFDDMGLFCGGKDVQHGENGGRCGVCGDNFSASKKANEPGPGNRYATGTIVANFQKGEIIEVDIQTTAYHKGYYEFKLCENNVPQKGYNAAVRVTQSCFEKNVLRSPSGNTRFIASKGPSTHKVKLPDHVTCSACVLQWRYRAGNSWGCEDGVCSLGNGPQEEFWGCADISIGGSSESRPQNNNPKPTTRRPVINLITKRPANNNDGGSKSCYSIPPYNSSSMDLYCNENCLAARPYCPRTHCKCQ